MCNTYVCVFYTSRAIHASYVTYNTISLGQIDNNVAGGTPLLGLVMDSRMPSKNNSRLALASRSFFVTCIAGPMPCGVTTSSEHSDT